MTVFDQLGLPAGVADLRDFAPIEDLVLGILRDSDYGLTAIPVHATIEETPALPFVLVRRMSGLGIWRGDQRGIYDTARIAVHVYAADPNGDMRAAVISEAVRKVMHRAFREHWRHADFGTVSKIRMISEPTRMSDWATSQGPVQYADLPTGVWRYESQYELIVRRPPRS